MDMMAIAEAGGEDYEDAGEEWIVWTAANDVMAVSKALEEQGIQVQGLRDHRGLDHPDGGLRYRRQEGPAPHRRSSTTSRTSTAPWT